MLIILFLISGYAFAVFVLLRLIAPFMGFRKYALPANIPPEVRQAILELESRSADQASYLKETYDFILQKNLQQWRHTRGKAALHIHRLFLRDLSKIWNTQGFVYCTGINFVTYVLLARSKFFVESDVRLRHVFANMVSHQYLQVKVGEKWVDADPAGIGIRGKPLGTHLAGFG